MCTPNAEKASGFDMCRAQLSECETLHELVSDMASEQDC